MSQFTYTIDEFNIDTKTLKVTFDDGGWASIALRAPLPTTEQEIDDIVKQFTATKEIMEARNGNINLNFINNMVGKSRTTDRFSTTPVVVNGISANPGEVML
jgi:hypothetical protein